MKTLARFVCLLAAALFLICAAPSGYAQNKITRGSATPGYVKMPPIEIHTIQPFGPGTVLMFPAKAATSRGSLPFASSNAAKDHSSSMNDASGNSQNGENDNRGSNIPGLLTVPTFTGAFAAEGGPDLGNVFPYIMIGNHPLLGQTTRIPAKITTVSLQLLNGDGSIFQNVPFAPFEDLTTDSPNFANSKYTSSDSPTQFADAVQRAEFFHTMEENWHTELNPSIVNRITIQIPPTVQVQFPDGSVKTVPAYFVGQAPDGSTIVEMLDLLFNDLYSNAVVNDIIANNFTTDAMNFDLFPNTFLFSIDNQGNPASCCVLGFHTYFLEGGVTPQPRWISIFASYISPGIFGGGFEDITGLSHEISEAFDDPFGDNPVPSWQFPIPGIPANAQVCQNNLETGDPVEVLPTSTVSINVRDRNKILTFHPQTEALLQWFEMGPTSDALHHAFSYPDETALTQSAVPCPPPTP
ncbi:MAG: hypothetical protein ACYDDI_00265 [Candidatus Acidiferrales bacterium]